MKSSIQKLIDSCPSQLDDKAQAQSELNALIAIVEAAKFAQRNLEARLHIGGRENFKFGQTLENLNDSLAALPETINQD